MKKADYSILKYLTPYRVFNVLQLYISFMLTRILGKVIHLGKPMSLSIEPTTACNLACPECPSGLKQFTRNTGKLQLDFHKTMLSQVKSHVFYINYYFQGEPFLHPEFLTLIREGKKSKIYTSTSTNAHFISKEKAKEIVASGLDRLIISIDGLTQETYAQYRVNGQLTKVIEGSTFLVEAKKDLGSKTPHLVFQFLVVQPNEHEIPAVFSLAKELSIDEVRIKTAQLYDYKNGNPLMPENNEYSRYILGKNGEYQLKGEQGNHCWKMWSGSVFTWDGLVVPCCFDKDAQHVLGDLKENEFGQIWKGPRYRSFRKSVFSSRTQIDICQNCSEGTTVFSE
ncbi:MAG: radical SAM protein [Bacteroidetes bacterium]|nr:SPASM domain-containing protein [Bacteroidota bacterium]MBM3418455.1 radical SAM protein [Bacteroidota bacterium]